MPIPPDQLNRLDFAVNYHGRGYGTRSLLKIYARGVVSYFYFSRAPRARAENQANKQCHFKSSRWRIELLDTDSCRGTVPMEPPMSNSSMRHRELLKWF